MASVLAVKADAGQPEPGMSIVKVGRNVLDEEDRIWTVDQVVNNFSLAARQFLHDVLSCPAHGFIGAMDAFGQQQNQNSVTEVHGMCR